MESFSSMVKRCRLSWAGLGALLLVFCALSLGASVALVDQFVPPRWLAFICVTISMIAVAFAVGNIRLFLISLIVMVIPLRIDVRLYEQSKASFVLAAVDVCLAGIVVLWLLDYVSGKRSNKVVLGRHFVPMLLLIGATVLSSATCTSKVAVGSALFDLLKFCGLVIVLSNNILGKREIRVILGALVCAACLASCLQVIQARTGIRFSSLGETQSLEIGSEFGFARTGATLGSSGNTAAAYLGPLLMLMGAVVLYCKSNIFIKLLTVLVACVIAYAIVLTLSRSIWISCPVASVLLLGLALKDRKIQVLTPAIMLLLVVPLYLLSHGIIATRLATAPAFASDARMPLIKQSFIMIAQNPITGVGAGNYGIAMWHYPLPGGTWQFVVHNTYLVYWAECGLGGLLGLIGLLYAGCASATVCGRVGDPTIKGLGVGALCFLVVYCANMLFEGGLLSGPVSLNLGVMLALVTAGERQTTIEIEVPPKDTAAVDSVPLPRPHGEVA